MIISDLYLSLKINQAVFITDSFLIITHLKYGLQKIITKTLFYLFTV